MLYHISHLQGDNTYNVIILQENEWQDDWVTFYSRHRLQHQLNMVEKSYGDREASELWSHLQVYLLFIHLLFFL